MVFYRKYRPQKVSELDLEEVKTKLTSILLAKEVPHAFLFTGPKGLGKTSSARILAKAINCEENSKLKTQNSKIQVKNKNLESESTEQSNDRIIEPCNKCDACVSITNGSNIDVIEIDAASNRGIDEIRDLREKIKYAPSNLSKKVYIIDEVHMLTQDAFNALLKTLEEPPSHAVFVLCTTELEKVPGTISSRTFHVQFKKPQEAEVVHSLERIVKGEKLEAEKEVLKAIFKMSEGSFRDAAKLLEELAIGAQGNKITLELFEKTFKTEGVEHDVEKLIDFLFKKQIKESLSVIDNLAKKGADFKYITEILAQKLHDLLINENDNLKATEQKQLLYLVNNSYGDIKLSVLPQIPLELVAVEWCIEGVQNSEVALDKSQDKEEVKEVEKEEPKKEIAEDNEESEKPGHGMFAKNARSEHFLAALLTALKRDNHSIAGILRGTKLVKIEKDSVQFETRYKFHRDKLSDSKVSKILDQRASELLKEKVHVVVNLVEK